MSGEEAGFAQLGRIVHSTGAHEPQRLIDPCAQAVILLRHLRISYEIEIPLMHLVQVGETALGEGAQQVQAGRGLVVCLQQALRVRHAAFLIEADTVDDVAAVRREGHAVDGLVAGGARFGELAGHAPDLYYRTSGGEGHHDRHLQQHLEGVADLRCGEFGEAFRAITTLQQKRAALGDLSELPAQLPCLASEHQWRQARQCVLDALQMRGVGVFGLLLDRFGSPAGGAPGVGHGN